jgi:hypothetical protein
MAALTSEARIQVEGNFVGFVMDHVKIRQVSRRLHQFTPPSCTLLMLQSSVTTLSPSVGAIGPREAVVSQ